MTLGRAVADTKAFLLETTVHGVRFLADPQSRCLERLLWAALISLSLSAASLLVARSFRDASDSPFVTTVDSVPITDLPFPAISVAQSGRHNDPWQAILRLALDQLQFDCLAANSTTCSGEAEAARSGDLAPLLAEAHWEAYNNVLYSGAAGLGYTKTIPSKTVCSRVSSQFGPKFLPAFANLVYMLRRNQTNRDEMGYLAQSLLRLDRATALTKVKEFIEERRWYYSGFFTCTSSVRSITEYEHIMVMLAFLITQGIASPDILLGQMLNSQFAYGGLYKYSDMEEFERLLTEILTPMFSDLLGIGDNIPMRVVDTYILGENGGGVVDYLKDGDDKVEEEICMVTKFFGFNVAKSEMQENLCRAGGESCCRVADSLSQKTRSVLRLMKYSLEPYSWRHREAGDVRDVTQAAEAMGYPLRERRALFALKPAVLGANFPAVQENKDTSSQENPVRFLRTYSNFGIVGTFNAEEFWTIHKDTPEMRDFYEEVHALPEGVDPVPVRQPRSSGPLNSLEMFLPVPDFDSDLKRTFTLHHPDDPADFVSRPIEVEPGKEYNILVTPSSREIDDNVAGLEESARNCRLGQEGTGSSGMYGKYTQAGCLFECNLKRAGSECGCVPWNYPRMNASFPLCHYESAADCFAPALSRWTTLPCNCPNECSKVSYSYQVQVMDSKMHQICWTEENPWLRTVGTQDIRNSLFSVSHYIDNVGLSLLLTKSPKTPQKSCQDTLPSSALVRIYIAPSSATVVTRSLRVTFSDQVANIGGLLGLFLGMSVISILEVMIWMLRTTLVVFRGDPRSKKGHGLKTV